MLDVNQKQKREFTRYPPLQGLDFYQLCKQFLSIPRYPLEASIVWIYAAYKQSTDFYLQIAQAQVLMRVYVMHSREWKQYLFDQRTKSNKDHKEGEIAEQMDENVEPTGEEIKPTHPASVKPQKRSRFVSKSESGSGVTFKRFYQPRAEKK